MAALRKTLDDYEAPAMLIDELEDAEKAYLKALELAADGAHRKAREDAGLA